MGIRKKLLLTLVFIALFTAVLCVSALGLMVGTVTGSTVNIRTGPGTEYDVIASLSYGEQIEVIELGKWHKVVFGDKTGYIISDYLAVENSKIAGYVSGSNVRLRTGPSTDYDIIATMAKGTEVEILEEKNGWFYLNTPYGTGYASCDYISRGINPATSRGDVSRDTSLADEIINYAEQFIGTKYKYGGASPSGFDCSGLVYYVLNHFDINLPRGATGQYNATTHISRSSLRKGDLVFFRGPGNSKIQHVGIYVGGGEMIHSPSAGKRVRIESIESGYYNTYYYGASRYLD